MAVVDWSTLPLDLLGVIAMKLEMIEDFIYFSAVCTSWNHVSSLIKHQWKPIPMPWLLLAENTSNNPLSVRKIFNPSNNKCYNLNLPETLGARCWGSNYGWLAMVDRNLNVCLFNPITKAEIHFPSAETIPDRPPRLERESEEEYINWVLEFFFIRLIVLKVSETEFLIVILYNNSTRLVFAKHGDKSWTSVFVRQERVWMFDVVAMNGYIFALYNDGLLVYWNFADFQRRELVKPMDYFLSDYEMFEPFKTDAVGKIYLVQSSCDLLMVLRFKEHVLCSEDDYDPDVAYETLSFLVFRLDPKDRRWEKVEDYATLFVGGNSSMSVSSKCLQGNMIYFTDDEFELANFLTSRFGGHDMGAYDMKSEKIKRFYEGDDIHSLYCRPAWFVAQP